MRRFLSSLLTLLGLLGIIIPEAFASSRVLNRLDSYANCRKIPQAVKDKIIKADLSEKEGNSTGDRKCTPAEGE